jgi:hypothetical protein
MKRAAPLERRTPLLAKTSLRRTALPATPLSRVAKRTAQPKRPKGGIPAKVRAALAVRSGGVCEIGAPGCDVRATDASHRTSVKMGGRHGAAAARHHVLSQLLHACRGCHSHLHQAPAAAYWRGWALREGEIPTEVPVLYRSAWVLLTDSGLLIPTTSTPGEVP